MIKETTHCTGEYISSIFIRPKKDGTYRLILNLKNLNDHVEYHHFKMDTNLVPRAFVPLDQWSENERLWGQPL